MKAIINKKELTINEADKDVNLLEYLRETLDLTGAKNGCGIGVCGACTILVNDEPKRACLLKVQDIIGKNVMTIEGMASADGTLHPLQQAFVDAGAIQCGFCTPGMVLTAHAFLLKTPHPTREQIRVALKGNLCRCTGYQQIIDAVQASSIHYQK
jgi:aerobic carbon-monoxide dehydrogenase small subunit